MSDIPTLTKHQTKGPLVGLPLEDRWRISVSWATVVVIVLTFGTAISPFIIAGQKNALVILVGLLSGPLFLFSRLRIGLDAFWAACAVMYFLVVETLLGTDEGLITVGYTGLLALAYTAFCGALTSGRIQTLGFRNLLRRLIQAYAVLSIAQMITSLAGLPVPNLILSKGLWSYNSLGVEPSHVARTLAFTMLVYLLLSRQDGLPPRLSQLWHNEKWLIVAFVTSCVLSGSALAVGAIIITLVLAMRSYWLIVAVCIIAPAWPILLSFEWESVARLDAFLASITSMDLDLIGVADHSASVRVAPILLFVEQMDIDSPRVWFGAGLEEIASYVRGRIPGVDPDAVMAGFVPGYIVSCGFVGTSLFFYAFVGRFINKKTLPFVVLLVLLLSTSAWNSQTFWFGLLMLRSLHHFHADHQRPLKYK